MQCCKLGKGENWFRCRRIRSASAAVIVLRMFYFGVLYDSDGLIVCASRYRRILLLRARDSEIIERGSLVGSSEKIKLPTLNINNMMVDINSFIGSLSGFERANPSWGSSPKVPFGSLALIIFKSLIKYFWIIYFNLTNL